MYTLAKIIDSKTGKVMVGLEQYKDFYIEQGFTYMDIELSYDETPYLKGSSPKQPLSSARLKKLQEINNEYDKEASLVKMGVPSNEEQSWDVQRLEAQGWKNDENFSTPFCDVLAAVREVEKAWLMNKILDKVYAHGQSIAKLTGKRQKIEDSIKASTSLEEIKKIHW